MPSEGAATSLPSCAQPGSSPVDQGSLVPLKGGQIKGGDFKLKDERDGKAEVQRVNWDSSATLLDFSIGTLPSNPFGLDSAQDNTSPGTGNVRVFEGISENQGSIDTQSGDGFLVFKECHYGSPRPDAHNSFRTFHEFGAPDQDSPESPFEVLGDSARAKSLGSEVSDITDHSQTQTLCPAPDFESDVPEPSPICPSLSSQVEDDPWKSDRDEAEILDADSSDESDDTVIEDTTDRFNLSKNVSSPQRRLEGPIESEMRPVSMALSYIKETNEHNLTEEDDEEEGDVCMPKAFPKAPKPGSQAAEDSPETASDPESIEPECSVSAATDSLVGFMRECLNSRQPKEPVERYGRHVAEDKSPQLAAPFSGSPPAVLLNMEEERLTICALKELGSSQEETEDLVQWTAAPQTNSKPQSGPVAPFAPKPPSPSLNKRPWEALPGGDVDGADANEPAQLAAHALAALLTNLSVRELVYWRDPRKSGLVLGSSLLVLLSLASFSVISVGSYLLLALLCVTITFRIYKSVIQAVQKSEEGHPFKALMEKDITIPPETFRKYTDLSLARLNHALKQLKRLFLVEDLVDSLKLAVLMWLLTYVGAVFNGITLLILADILLFSSPLVYEKNKTQIDHYVGIVRTQVDTTLAKLQEKLPGAVKRSKAE
ncbi:hypothetical protein COCON_G00081210 [Conger conger]|uniref:Reticulon n=1 Tax=Conger conger TaxID=82655 RepID=A0A9Q1DPP4_CONCO|nr:hypothetical protein COCON_G00081210 [Conger conger]